MRVVHSTSAIILKTVKYGDSSLIVNVYTKEHGLIGLMARGIHTSKSKFSNALFQPLNLVEIVFSENNKSNLRNLKDISLEAPYQTIPHHYLKSTILMFINEILYKILKEEQPNAELFDFISQSLLLLDSKNEQYADIHLFFLAGLTRFLGIEPNFSQEGAWFDLSEGVITTTMPLHQYYLEKEHKELFLKLFQDLQHDTLNITNQQRSQLLNNLLLYYELHFPGLHNIKSRAVLHEMLQH